MTKLGLRSSTVAALAATLFAGVAHAQQISATNDYTLSWSGSSFGGASTLYSVEEAYGTNAFTDALFNLYLYTDATNLTLNNAGAVTISSPSLTPPAPYSQPVPVTFSNDGTGDGGSWGATYNTAQPVSLGTLGGLPTLTFDAYNSESISGIDYYIFAYLPGNWTTEGTSPGDYTNVSVGDGFSTPTFTYNNGVTTVETFTADYDGAGDNLRFTLIGSVPEPSTWALLALGFAGIGYAGRRSRKAVSIAV